MRRAWIIAGLAVMAALVALAGCGSSAPSSSTASTGSTGKQAAASQSAPAPIGIRPHPHVVEPVAGAGASSDPTASDPVGDPNAHPVSLAEVKRELAIE